jgi:HEAT repeat protein
VSAPDLVRHPAPRGSDEFDASAPVIDRAGDAARAIEFILAATSRFVVLHGRPGSGRTQLVKRWILPALARTPAAAGYEVWYGDCAAGLPATLQGANGSRGLDEALAGPAIVFADGFTEVLDLPRDERRAVLDRLSAALERGDPRARIVLITDTRHLTTVYSLGSDDPSLSRAVLEIGFPRIDDALVSLRGYRPDSAVAYGSAMLAALVEDARVLEEQGWDVTFDLITVLDRQFRRFAADAGVPQVELGHYEALSRLPGLLRSQFDDYLGALEAAQSGSEEVAQALLERIADAQVHAGQAEFDDLPLLVGQPPPRVSAILARLAGPGGIAKRSGRTGYRLVPPALASVIHQDRENRRPKLDRVLRTVAEGLRTYQELGQLLSRNRFREVHRVRRHLSLDRDQTRFLLQCALRHEDGETPGASAYWLARVPDRSDGLAVLVTASLDADPAVRARAAHCLRGFTDPDVVARLRDIALDDPDPAVRSAALSTLEPLGDQESCALFVLEARDPASVRRAAAIEGLRIFPGSGVQEVLQALVNDPQTPADLRATAIGVLATQPTRAAIAALVEIALYDEDQADRDAAGEALARSRARELHTDMLDRLAMPERAVGRRIAAGLLALGLGGVGLLFWGVVIALADSDVRVAAWVLVGSLLLVPPTSMLLRRMRDGRLPLPSGLGVLAALLAALAGVSVLVPLHGAGHALLARWSRAAALFGLEVIGLVFVIAGGLASDMMPAVWISRVYVPITMVVGALLFIASYVYDLAGLLFATVLRTRAGERDTRRRAVYRQVFANPEVSGLVFAGLEGDADGARRSRRLIRLFGAATSLDQLLTQLARPRSEGARLALRILQRRKSDETVRRLETAWGAADQVLRRRIMTVWCRLPNERSLQALKAVRRDLALPARARCGLAQVRFRLGIWPAWVWLLILWALPPALALPYHGVMVLTNPAWGQIVSLGSRANAGGWIFYTDDQRLISTIEILGRYPDEAADVFLRHLRAYSFRSRPPVHARIATELTAMHPADPPYWEEPQRHQAVRDQLVREAYRFHSWLLFGRSPDTWLGGDSAAVTGALEALGAMAGAADLVVADTATWALTDFALDSAADSLTALRALDALAGLPYERALPVLDRMYSARRGVPLGDSARLRLDHVAERATAAARAGDAPVEVPRLVAVLDSLSYKPSGYRATRRLAASLGREAAQLAERCDRDHDGRCDRTDTLYALIDEDPASEGPYRELLGRYQAESRYRDAAGLFTQLRDSHPASIWPRKVLAELYHEYLPREDPRAFARSYEEMTGLRALAAYRQLRADSAPDYFRVEADFAEITLSAGHTSELGRVARDLVARSDDPTYHFNMALFIYLGHVVRGDRDSADAALTRLAGVVDSLEESFYNRWIYPGTLHFIRQAGLPADLEQALLDLCREGYWHPRDRAAAVIGANRSALRRLPARVASGSG